MTRVPAHVSIIMDGNGRWAKERGKERVFGHFEGVESVRACVEAAVETGVRYLSLFAFSEENWNRPQDEVITLMGLMVKAMANEMDSLDSNGVRFVVLGNRDRLNDDLNRTIDECMERTKGNTTLTLIIFLTKHCILPFRMLGEFLRHLYGSLKNIPFTAVAEENDQSKGRVALSPLHTFVNSTI